MYHTAFFFQHRRFHRIHDESRQRTEIQKAGKHTVYRDQDHKLNQSARDNGIEIITLEKHTRPDVVSTSELITAVTTMEITMPTVLPFLSCRQKAVSPAPEAVPSRQRPL